MSFDILVYVRHRVTQPNLDAALDALGAPIAAPGEPDEFEGFVPVEIDVPGMEFIGAGGFQASCSPAEDDKLDNENAEHEGLGFVPACMYSLSRDDEDDRVAWVVALAIARAGSGVIIDPQEGKTYGTKEEKKIEASARRWRTAIERNYEKLPAAEKEFRKQRPDETPEVFRRRLWLARTPQDEVARYLKTEFASALLNGNDKEIKRIIGLFPPGDVSFLESIVDPCARANRADIAKQMTAGFSARVLRAHFMTSAGWVGFAAAPYTRFLVESGVVRLDEQMRNKARAIAMDPEIQAWLDHYAQPLPAKLEQFAIPYRAAFPRDVLADVDAVLRHCSIADSTSQVGNLGEVTIAGETLVIPYRIYLKEPNPQAMLALGRRARVVLACLMTRHHDGYVRERSVRQLLPSTEAWVPPFIFQLLGEYVVEIQAFIASHIKDLESESYRSFARQHPSFIQRTCRRIVSYWQCYWPREFPQLSEYPGFVAINALGLWDKRNGRRLLKNVKIVELAIDTPIAEADKNVSRGQFVAADAFIDVMDVENPKEIFVNAAKVKNRRFFAGQRVTAIHTLDELLEQARNAPFFTQLGKKHRRDRYVSRSARVEDWPGPEDEDCAALFDLLNRTLEVCRKANPLLDNNPISVEISRRFPVNLRQDAWHAEYASRSELIAIAKILAHWANKGAAPPGEILELWRWYCDGHWPWGMVDESCGEVDAEDPHTLCVI